MLKKTVYLFFRSLESIKHICGFSFSKDKDKQINFQEKDFVSRKNLHILINYFHQ